MCMASSRPKATSRRTREFISAAASLLGVREAWLLTGSGTMTALEDSVWNVMQDHLGRRDDESIEAEGLRMGMSRGVEALLYETVAQYIATASDAEEIGPEQTRQMFHDIYWLCGLPRELWGFQYGLPTSQLNSYMTAMLLALQIVLRPPSSVTSGLVGHGDSPIHGLKDVLPSRWGVVGPPGAGGQGLTPDRD